MSKTLEEYESMLERIDDCRREILDKVCSHLDKHGIRYDRNQFNTFLVALEPVARESGVTPEETVAVITTIIKKEQK